MSRFPAKTLRLRTPAVEELDQSLADEEEHFPLRHPLGLGAGTGLDTAKKIAVHKFRKSI
jgi:hypothetical protein